VKGAAVTAALTALTAGIGFGPAGALLDHVLPQPGQGPSEKTRRTGRFQMKIHTRTSAGAGYAATAAARSGPGCQATSVMLGETALRLALDRDRLPDHAGVLTPATAMGTILAGRLKAAGHTPSPRKGPTHHSPCAGTPAPQPSPQPDTHRRPPEPATPPRDALSAA
jgi:short subunit dehydrogenase-like uncharacterized protein